MTIEVSEKKGVRYLHFGSHWIQGAMRIARPWALELEYTRDMMMPLVIHPDPGWPANVLQIGLGAASLTRFLYRHRPAARLTVVEIVPEVVAAARQFFKLPEDPARLAIEIAEGHDYITSRKHRFDLILVDGFDAKGRPGMLDTVPFYHQCRARLADGGMLSINLLTRHRGGAASLERLRSAFAEVVVMPPSEAGNVVAVAARETLGGFSFDELRENARALKVSTGLNLLPAVARLEKARPDPVTESAR